MWLQIFEQNSAKIHKHSWKNDKKHVFVVNIIYLSEDPKKKSVKMTVFKIRFFERLRAMLTMFI